MGTSRSETERRNKVTATFLVTLNISDTSATSLADLSEDIHEALAADGQDVEDVKPWARPSLQIAPSVPPPDLMQPPPNPFA